MKLFEFNDAQPRLTPSPDAGMNPAPKPGSASVDPKAVSGANTMRGVTGQGGSAVAKALGALGSGKMLTPGLAKALDPYADALTAILSNPQLRSQFVRLMKLATKKAPAESVTEDQDSVDAVAGAITRRIMMQHADLLSKYGPVKVMAAIDDVADFAGSDGLDEIGSSDVSIWTKQVIQDLESGHFDHMESTREAEDEDEDDWYDKDGRPNPNGAFDAAGHYYPERDNRYEENKKLDEFLPALGAMAGRALVGAEAGAMARGVASGVGRAVGTMASDALDDNDEDPTDDASNGDAVDKVTMDIPLLLRVLEFAREDAKEDMDLHDAVERMIVMSKDGPLSMDDYDSIVGSVEALPAPEEKPMDEGYYAPGPETMPGAVGPQDTTTVSFNQSKQMGDATLNINASAKDMEELHRILKLAGIDYASDGEKQEPSMQDVAVALAPHAPEAPAEEPCGCQDEKPTDVKYSTDKQTLINVLRDKLQKRLA